MNITTVPGYALALVVDDLYGLPHPLTVGVWRLGDYNPRGKLPESHKLFLGTGEGFNNWKHKFEEGEESIGVVIRIRLAGFYGFESLGQLSLIEGEEQILTLSDNHVLMSIDGVKQLEQDLRVVKNTFTKRLADDAKKKRIIKDAEKAMEEAKRSIEFGAATEEHE